MLNLIPLLFNKTVYNKYSNILNNLYTNTNSKEIKLLYMYLEELHNKYPDKDILYEEFALYVLVRTQEKDKDTISGMLELIKEPPSIVLEDTLHELQNKQKAYDLAVAALEVSEGRKEFNDLLVLTEKLNATKSDSDSLEGMFVTNDLEELHNDTIKQQGLRWRMATLNRMLGSLRRGDFGFIFARPETGKTTFLASEISGFAQQASGSILWFNNEEQGNKVQLRLYQAMLGCTLTELFSDVQGNKRRYLERGGDKIKIFDSASIHRKQVEQLVRELEPSLVIFDQLDKVKGFADDREDLRLGGIYIWAREIAKQYCPVIAVCQADASGEGKKWLTMENVANAKTAKQAEADWILGIGKSHNDTEQKDRFLHLCKNKLAGDEDTDPDLRHGKAVVRIEPTIARYIDVQ